MRSGPGMVVLALVTGAVVAVAAGGVQLLLPAERLGDAWIVGVRVVGMGVVAAGVAWLLLQRHRLLARGERSPDPTYVGLRTAATIMGVVFLLGLLNPPPPPARSEAAGMPFGLPDINPFGNDGPGGGDLEARTRGGDSSVRGSGDPIDAPTLPGVAMGEQAQRSLLQRAVGYLVWGLLFLLFAYMAARWLQRRARPPTWEFELEVPVPRDRAREGLEASLEEVAEETYDPRGQIARAYHRLLTALSDAGAPREPQEAPHEHLRRALAPLGVQPEPLHRLAGLYVLAEFGGRPVTESHRTAAARALETSLEQLRRVDARPGRRARAGAGST